MMSRIPDFTAVQFEPVVAANPAAKDRGLGAGDLVKGALSGRGGGNADLAQGGGVPADQVPALLAQIEKLVANASQ